MASVNRLRLGPIVGHTDDQSVRIWIRAFDEPALYTLTVHGIGEFQFVSTEKSFEFGTAIALADRLRANHRYRYTVRRLGRTVRGALGSFQTMPPPEYLNEISFVAISCSHQVDAGAWEKLKQFIEDTQPRFLLMMGDQIYNDSSTETVPDVWESNREGPPEKRRHLIAEKYQENWSRSYVSEILANIPCYMMWDDHDIRNGWGSFAPDSETLSDQYPSGRPIHEKYAAFFRDARDVCWHFQMVHNPPPLVNAISQPPPPSVYELGSPPYSGTENPVDAMPFVFRAGRAAILVADGRGQRDVWREKDPILGTEQWKFLTSVVDGLPENIDAVIVITQAPIVCMSPYGQTQLIVGSRTDDVSLFKEGDEAGLDTMYSTTGKESRSSQAGNVFVAPFVFYTAADAPIATNLGTLKLDSVSDARDQWSHHLSRPEQEKLIRLAARARASNRTAGSPRGLLFVGGDLHAGGLFRIDMTEPACSFECLISSGISKSAGEEFPGLLGTLVDSQFDVAEGIEATLKYFVKDYNFGIITVIPDRKGAHITAHLAHTGESSNTWGIRLEQPRELNRLRDKARGLKVI